MLMYITQIVHNCLSLIVHFAVYLEKKKKIGYVWAESLNVLLKKKGKKLGGGGGVEST